nr:MAG TPA: hypothetical protein [Caudoviricetes sp.]
MVVAAQKYLPLHPGKSYTASSLRILQGLIAAKVVGCSGARRYNQLPLLRSSPGGFEGSWPYRTYPGAKVGIFIKPAIGDRYFFACFTGKLLLFRYLKSKKNVFFSDRIALLTLTGINSIPNNIICTFVRYLLIK